nr:MAG TPA: hydrogenase maturation protein [Bacteriophage sp.]
MKIEITPEEMLERFKLYGEIYLLLAPVYEYDNMDGFRIEIYEIADKLNLKDEIFFHADGIEVRFIGVEFIEDMINILYINDNECGIYSHPVIHLETESIRKVKSILEQYVKAIIHE